MPDSALVNILFNRCRLRRFDRRRRRLKALKPGRKQFYTLESEKGALRRTLKKIKDTRSIVPNRNSEPHIKAVVKRVFLKEVAKEHPRYDSIPCFFYFLTNVGFRFGKQHLRGIKHLETNRAAFAYGAMLHRRPSSAKFVRGIRKRHPVLYHKCMYKPVSPSPKVHKQKPYSNFVFSEMTIFQTFEGRTTIKNIPTLDFDFHRDIEVLQVRTQCFLSCTVS